MRTFSLVILIALTCTALICGCTMPGSPANQPAATSAAPQAVVTAGPTPNGLVKNVAIIQRAFDPDIITISPGTTVIWTNRDTINHRVVYINDPLHPSEKELFHSDLLYPGDTFSFTFYTVGEYSYADPQLGSGRHSKVIVK